MALAYTEYPRHDALVKYTVSLLGNPAASPHPSRFTNPPEDISSSCSHFCDRSHACLVISVQTISRN